MSNPQAEWDQAQALLRALGERVGGSVDAYAPEPSDELRRILGEPFPERTPAPRNMEEHGLRIEEDPGLPPPIQEEVVLTPVPEPIGDPDVHVIVPEDPMAYNPILDMGPPDLTLDDAVDEELASFLHNVGSLAPLPIDDGYLFQAAVVDCGELAQVAEAFALVLDGMEDVTVELESGTYTVYEGIGIRSITDETKNREYRIGNPEEHGLDKSKLLVWVDDPTTDEALGYIYDGWVYMKK